MFTIAVKGASMATASEIMQEVDTRASTLIAKSSTPLSKAAAYSQIFKADPQLYARYRAAQQLDVGSQVMLTKQDGTTAPSFGSELLRRQMDGFYELTSALLSTLSAIVSADSGDKGALVQQALDAFTAAVRQAFAQAGIAVPVAKQALLPASLEASVLRTCLHLAPRDPLGQGGEVLAKALQQLRQDLAA
jgi:hypothetical protein